MNRFLMNTEYNGNFSSFLRRVGERLYTLRNNRREKLASMARNVNVSASVISKVENGLYECLTVSLLTKFAHYHKMTVDELLKPVLEAETLP